MRELIKYSFLAKIRDLSLVFWAACISSCPDYGYVYFIGQMEESDFETIPAAIVTQSTGEEDVFQEYLETVGDEQEALVSVRPMVEEEAVTALENGDCRGNLLQRGRAFSYSRRKRTRTEYPPDDTGELYRRKTDAGRCIRTASGGDGSSHPSDVGLRISDRRCVSRRTDDEYDSTVLLRIDRDGVPVRMLHRLPVCYGSAGKPVGSGGAAVCESCAQDAVDPFRDSGIFRPSFFLI